MSRPAGRELAVSVDLFEHVYGFWKPMVDRQELSGLASFGNLADPPSPGIRVLRPDSEPHGYRVMHAGARILLFAAVQPIDEPPEAAEVLAEIRDMSGNRYSFLLWYPKDKCAVVPFDPNTAVESLRLERYMPESQKTVLPSPILSAYYALKPLLPAPVRMKLRRLLAKRADGQSPAQGHQVPGSATASRYHGPGHRPHLLLPGLGASAECTSAEASRNRELRARREGLKRARISPGAV